MIEAFGEVYEGSDRPIIATSGFALLPRGETFTEDMPLPPINPAFPRAPEHSIMTIADRGARPPPRAGGGAPRGRARPEAAAYRVGPLSRLRRQLPQWRSIR